MTSQKKPPQLLIPQPQLQTPKIEIPEVVREFERSSLRKPTAPDVEHRSSTLNLSDEDMENITNATREEREQWAEMFAFLVGEVLNKTPIDVRESYHQGFWQFDIQDGCLGFRFFQDAPKDGMQRVTYYVMEALKNTPNKWFEVEGEDGALDDMILS